MSAAIVDGEPGARSPDGAARLEFSRRGAVTELGRLFQQGSLRVLRPNVPAGEPACAVLLNTSGGDVLQIEGCLAPDAAAMITTQGAEKVYRSAGALSTVDVRLALGADTWLEWLRQDTILFDRARLRRRLVPDLAASARLLAADLLVFGRRARRAVPQRPVPRPLGSSLCRPDGVGGRLAACGRTWRTAGRALRFRRRRRRRHRHLCRAGCRGSARVRARPDRPVGCAQRRHLFGACADFAVAG